MFASGAEPLETPSANDAVLQNESSEREALPGYSAALLAESLLMASAAQGAPLLFRATARAGALTRLSLPHSLYALAGAGFQFDMPSLPSEMGVSYRPFFSAWLEGGIGWTEPRLGLGAELSSSLHSGGVPGTYAAEAMLGASLSLILRSTSSSPWGRKTQAGIPPRYRAELAIPLGLALRADSFSLYSGVGVRLWRDPLGGKP